MLKVDGYAGFKRVAGERAGNSVQLAFCWVHMRRAFFQFHASTGSPIAAELLARVASLYAIEAEIRGHPAEHRRKVRCARSRPIVEASHDWLHDQLPRISGASDLAKAMRYAMRHWPGLVAFLDEGLIEMDTNTVERVIRPITLTRKNALFAGSDGGARHWAIAMTLIQTAKLNGVEPMVWLTDVLERMSPAAGTWPRFVAGTQSPRWVSDEHCMPWASDSVCTGATCRDARTSCCRGGKRSFWFTVANGMLTRAVQSSGQPEPAQFPVLEAVPRWLPIARLKPGGFHGRRPRALRQWA